MAMDKMEPPSLDWKALESRLAQLQQRETKKEADVSMQYCTGYSPGAWNLDLADDLGEDKEMTKRIKALTSGKQTHRSMQLCFINDSSSDLDSEEEDAHSPLEQERFLQDAEGLKCWLEAEDLNKMSFDQLQRLTQGISLDIQRLNLELLQELTERDDLQMHRDSLLVHVQELTHGNDRQTRPACMLVHLQESSSPARELKPESKQEHALQMGTSQSNGC